MLRLISQAIPATRRMQLHPANAVQMMQQCYPHYFIFGHHIRVNLHPQRTLIVPPTRRRTFGDNDARAVGGDGGGLGPVWGVCSPATRDEQALHRPRHRVPPVAAAT